MPARPYSARVMSGRGGWRIETFTVPEGMRLVILHLSIIVWSAPGTVVFVWVHGIPVWYLSSQVVNEAHYQAVRLTAYERETVEIWVQGADVAYGVDGFLLDDPDGTPDDADNTIRPWSRADPLPARPRLEGLQG